MADIFSTVNFTAIMNNLVNNFIEGLVAALVVIIFFILGYIIAAILVNVLRNIIKQLEVEEKITQYGLGKALMGLTVTDILTKLLKVYIIFAFLGAAAQIVNIRFFSDIIAGFLGYLPSLTQGLAIIVVALFIAEYFVTRLRENKEIAFAGYLATGVKILFIYVAIAMSIRLILPNLGTEALLLQHILEYGIIAVFAAFTIGFGLALGMGLKDPISKAALKNQDQFNNFFSIIKKKRK